MRVLKHLSLFLFSLFVSGYIAYYFLPDLARLTRTYSQNDYKVANVNLGFDFLDTILPSMQSPQKLLHLRDETKKYNREFWSTPLRPGPNKQYVSIVSNKSNGELVYSAKYSTDEKRRRKTSYNSLKNEKAVMFWGGSFMFGEGVSDEETLPSHFSQLRADTNSYNFGIQGGSLNDAFDTVLNTSFNSMTQLKEAHKVGVYLYIDFHLHRFFGDSKCISWCKSRSYYEKTSEGWVSHGSFLAARPITTNIALRMSKLKKFNESGIYFPLKYKPSVSFAKAMVDFYKLLKIKRGLDSFYFVIFPDNFLLHQDAKEILKNAGIIVLDYSRLPLSTILKNNHMIHIDGHPTGLTYKLFANLLNAEIPK